jgi:hypothetical protein
MFISDDRLGRSGIVKQLDYGMDDTFGTGLAETVSFALMDSSAEGDAEEPCASGTKRCSRI